MTLDWIGWTKEFILLFRYVLWSIISKYMVSNKGKGNPKKAKYIYVL